MSTICSSRVFIVAYPVSRAMETSFPHENKPSTSILCTPCNFQWTIFCWSAVAVDFTLSH